MRGADFLSGSLFAAALLLAGSGAMAHCDSVDGPVAQAVGKALENGNIYLVLPYAPASAEPELKATFAEARKVRRLGEDARALADRSFLETAIRLHRAGEGAAYTGLKPAGIDYGPMIPAAERSVETGDVQPVQAVLAQVIEHTLREKLEQVQELRKASKEPTGDGGVEAARERISAELGFITFAESLRQVVLGDVPLHHED